MFGSKGWRGRETTRGELQGSEFGGRGVACVDVCPVDGPGHRFSGVGSRVRCSGFGVRGIGVGSLGLEVGEQGLGSGV